MTRRSSARARADLPLHEEPSLEQLADTLCDDRPTQARSSDELGARPGAAKADLVEDGYEGVECLLGDRTAARRPVAAGRRP
ncbi:MAG TPA: hypothetical protein VFR14_02495 [Candidatus Limnocylindrales bacterium]|nr:hypothetical protein [Candidatus Limnocylindrales bacterium]